jgi:hypothetical protein
MWTVRPLGKLTRDAAPAPAGGALAPSDVAAVPLPVGLVFACAAEGLALDEEWSFPRSCCTATTRPVIALIRAAAAVSIPGSVCHQLRLPRSAEPSLTAGLSRRRRRSSKRPLDATSAAARPSCHWRAKRIVREPAGKTRAVAIAAFAILVGVAFLAAIVWPRKEKLSAIPPFSGS